MSILKEIQSFIEAKHPNCAVSLVQFTKSQSKGDTMHFYVFVNSRIEYMVTTYKKDSVKRMQSENEIMSGLLKGISDPLFLNSILFSFDMLTIGGGCFRIQKYVDFQNVRRRNQKMSVPLGEKYLNSSLDWALKFQTLGGHQSYNIDVLKEEIDEMAKTLPVNHCLIPGLNQLGEALSLEPWDLKKGFSHGDFCFYNYLLKEDGSFQVFDWEHATDSYWSVFDPVLNFVTIWIHFYNNRKVKNVFEVLCRNRVDTEGEHMMVAQFGKIRHQYGLTHKQFVILVVFVFYRAMMREGKYVSPPCDPKFMNRMGLLSWVMDRE